MEKVEYKNTLNMPQTNFSMKADLPTKEANYRQKWLEQNLYQKILEQNRNNKSYILHDGPPYANGSIHMGHALNKVLKDIIVRYRSMQGYFSPYQAGWDTHGLPIENKMLNEMDLSHKDISVADLRKAAAEYAISQIEVQKKEFQELQLLSDFKEIYITLDPAYEAQQLVLFKKMALDGLIYKGLKPVYWSPSSQSALAEAEVEYADHRSPSVYVALDVIQGNEYVNVGDKLIIWTTTPWTLIANAGVAVGVDFEYVKIKTNNQHYIIAEKLLPTVSELLNWTTFKIVSHFQGANLLGLIYQRPVKTKLSAPVVAGHHVGLDVGTGLVHMAPLFGEDDFLIGKKEKLDMIMHVKDDGTFSDEAEEYAGLFYEDANKEIGLFLEKNNTLLSLKFIKHSYPHDWRTKKPIIFRGTPQWFVSIEKIRHKILEQIDSVKFYAEWAKKRLKSMIENRDDWTISRQRAWGVPIPVFYDEKQQPIMQEDIFDYVIAIVQKEGTDAWFNKETDQLLPPQYRGRNWTKETNIMDVWFDSGSSSIGVRPQGLSAPFDLYLEGSDQYRGWFNSSLISSVAYRNKAPYKQLVSHGFVVDEKGRKMSKSLGNGVAPLEITRDLGADILRLWVANSEYTSDISISKNIVNQNVEIYRKLRNTIRFLLGNLHDYQHQDTMELSGINALVAERIRNLQNKIVADYERYRFINVIKNLNNFIIEMSSFYLSITKDVLYAEKANSQARREVQYNLFNLLELMLISLAPIIPTTTEEAYSLLQKQNKKFSVHLETFLQPVKISTNEEAKWAPFFELKDIVYRAIEEQIKKGTIKRSNEALVTIKIDNEFCKSLPLEYLLMVGKVQFGNELLVEKFNSEKCQRCWNHFETSTLKCGLCIRCQTVLQK